MRKGIEIANHPHREEIIDALVNGVTYRDIERQYGINRSTLSRLVRSELGRKVAAAGRAKDIMDGTYLVESAGVAAESLRKMLVACNTYLEDPDDPSAFAIGPRAEEVDIVVEQYDEEGRVIGTERDTLQAFINRIEQRGGKVVEAKYRHEDPRKLVVQTADAVNRQLAVVAKISERAMGIQTDREERRRVVESELWRDMSKVILQAIDRCPEAREEIRGELERVRDRHTGD